MPSRMKGDELNSKIPTVQHFPTPQLLQLPTTIASLFLPFQSISNLLHYPSQLLGISTLYQGLQLPWIQSTPSPACHLVACLPCRHSFSIIPLPFAWLLCMDDLMRLDSREAELILTIVILLRLILNVVALLRSHTLGRHCFGRCVGHAILGCNPT